MRWRGAFVPALAVALAIAAANCGSDEADPGSTADAGTADAEGDGASDTASSSPFGIDTRPANPTCKAPARPPTGTGAKIAAAFTQLPQLVDPVAIQKVPG